MLENLKEQARNLSSRELQQEAFNRLLPLGKKEDPSFHTLLRQTLDVLEDHKGLQAALNLLLRLEVALGLRKPTLAIYDHTFHIIGGGEKYGFTAAHALQDDFDVTILSNRDVTHENIKDWYHLDLSRCKIKILPIPFYEELGVDHLDPARVSRRMENPFHLVAGESGNYDFFINNGMNEMVMPLANISAMIVHFPERRPVSYFYSHRYTHIIYNSKYTAGWIKKKWDITPHKHIFPPVDMALSEDSISKENIILSVARFETGGSKKQLEMVRTFLKLQQKAPDLLAHWTLVLAGGSHGENPYLEKVKQYIQDQDIKNVEIMTNIPGDELKSLYRKARIFWHLCGLDQRDPALVEHFGMTIVEAMQNSIAPIVFDGGGQREIVEQGISGYRVKSTSQLIKYSLSLMEEKGLREKISAAALERSKLFTRERFEERVNTYFNQLLEEYKSTSNSTPQETK